jgi:hypothetical protein
MKRLRKKYSHKKLSFYHCGEYGEKQGRPHYHAIIFNHQFSDLIPIPQNPKTPKPRVLTDVYKSKFSQLVEDGLGLDL